MKPYLYCFLLFFFWKSIFYLILVENVDSFSSFLIYLKGDFSFPLFPISFCSLMYSIILHDIRIDPTISDSVWIVFLQIDKKNMIKCSVVRLYMLGESFFLKNYFCRTMKSQFMCHVFLMHLHISFLNV